MGDLLESIREIHQIGEDTPEQLVPGSNVPGLAARGIFVLGISDAGVGYKMSRLNPQWHHFIACFGGSGKVLVDGHWKKCGPGCAYISPAHTTMAFETDGKHRWQFAWVWLWPDQWQMTHHQSYIEAVDPRQLVTAIEGLYREASSTPSDTQLIDTWCHLAAAHARRIINPADVADPLWQLWATVDARLSEEWTLERLSAEAAIAPEALRRLCQRTLKRSPMRQVAELRMRRAKTLLESTPAKILAVAGMVGYTNVFAFSSAFKRWSGQSPSDCRPG